MHTATYVKSKKHTLCLTSSTHLINGIHDDCFLCIVTVVHQGNAPKHVSLNRIQEGRYFCGLTLTIVSVYAVHVSTFVLLSFVMCLCVYGTLSITVEIFDVWHEDIQSFE